jgi:hypothetical protein
LQLVEAEEQAAEAAAAAKEEEERLAEEAGPNQVQQLHYVVWNTHGDKHPSHRRVVVLTNNTATPTSFSLTASAPFAVESCKSSSVTSHPLSRTGAGVDLSMSLSKERGMALDTTYREDRLFTLPPLANIEVTLAYYWRVGDRYKKRLKKKLQPELKYADQGEFVVTFANGDTQRVQLLAQVLRPTVTVLPGGHDFGVVHCESTKSVVLHIGNPTPVDAKWTIQHVPGVSKHENPDVFKFGTVAGILAGPTMPVDSGVVSSNPPTAIMLRKNMPLAIKVTFQPETAGKCQARFRFAVDKGNYFDLDLVAEGTFEEEDEVMRLNGEMFGGSKRI